MPLHKKDFIATVANVANTHHGRVRCGPKSGALEAQGTMECPPGERSDMIQERGMFPAAEVELWVPP